MDIRFEWGAAKAKTNLKKHGVTFEEAATVFSDTLSLTIPNPQHSEDEDRFIVVGTSANRRLLVVVHTEYDETVRLISARPATRHERNHYEQGNAEA